VAKIGLAGGRKKLEAMKIDNTVTYGDYFAMSAQGAYRITVEIRSAGAVKPALAEFAYRHNR